MLGGEAIKWSKSKDIYIEDSYTGVTLGALGLSHGTILIDAPPCPEDTRSWRAALRNLGSGVNRLLINLDDHFDRTLGARAMECPVMAHIETANSFHNQSAVFKGHAPESGADWQQCIGLSGIRWATPSLTYSNRAVLNWDKHPLILEHHPGPTPGATWIVLPEIPRSICGRCSPAKPTPLSGQSRFERLGRCT